MLPEDLAPSMVGKKIIDGRNVLDPSRWRNAGWSTDRWVAPEDKRSISEESHLLGEFRLVRARGDVCCPAGCEPGRYGEAAER
jgi:hypothetical protein